MQPTIATPLTKLTKKYYPALTGLRAAAAYMVVLFHANGAAMAVEPNLLERFVNTWYSGVTIFFVLSGFLIATRYNDSLELSGPWLRKYFQNRFARIYPVYSLLTALTFICFRNIGLIVHNSIWTGATSKEKLFYLFLNGSLLRGFFEQAFNVGIAPAWSLTVEETFYLLAPLLLLGLRRRWWLILVYPIVLYTIGWGIAHFCAGAPYGLMGSIGYMLDYTFFGRCLEFIIGIGLALLCKRTSTTTRILYTVTGSIGLLVGLAILVYLAPAVADTSYSYIALCFSLFVIPFPIALLLLGLIHENTWLSRLLSTPLAQLLGKASYALYLLHLTPMTQLFTYYVSKNVGIQIVAYTLVSIALYKLVEHPLHDLIRAKK